MLSADGESADLRIKRRNDDPAAVTGRQPPRAGIEHQQQAKPRTESSGPTFFSTAPHTREIIRNSFAMHSVGFYHTLQAKGWSNTLISRKTTRRRCQLSSGRPGPEHRLCHPKQTRNRQTKTNLENTHQINGVAEHFTTTPRQQRIKNAGSPPTPDACSVPS